MKIHLILLLALTTLFSCNKPEEIFIGNWSLIEAENFGQDADYQDMYFSFGQDENLYVLDNEDPSHIIWQGKYKIEESRISFEIKLVDNKSNWKGLIKKQESNYEYDGDSILLTNISQNYEYKYVDLRRKDKIIKNCEEKINNLNHAQEIGLNFYFRPLIRESDNINKLADTKGAKQLMSNDTRVELAKQYLANNISTKSNGHLGLVDFQKTNGLESNINGVQYYEIEYSCTIKVLKSGYIEYDPVFGSKMVFVEFDGSSVLYLSDEKRFGCKLLSEGEKYLLTGKVYIQNSDNAWSGKDFTILNSKSI